MNFPMIFKGILHTLIQQAETELGAGKGAEKKAWVLTQLRNAITAAKWPSWIIEFVVQAAGLLVDFLVKEALELLGKQS